MCRVGQIFWQLHLRLQHGEMMDCSLLLTEVCEYRFKSTVNYSNILIYRSEDCLTVVKFFATVGVLEEVAKSD